MDVENVQFLDCTLRDGGLGLEDAEKNGLSSLRFDPEDRRTIADSLASSGMDIIELGSIEITGDDRRGFAIYPDIRAISSVMPEKKHPDQLFAALFRGPDTPVSDIPQWEPGLCEAIRVIIRYSELQKSLDFCASLSEKGYKVFVQPMVTMRYSDSELSHLLSESNAMHAYAVYFVDSYGYMLGSDIDRLFGMYDSMLDSGIRVGFHAHNNINMALSNVLHFLEIGSSRRKIADSCLLGMGQGAGNLQTELLAGTLGGQLRGRFDIRGILNGCETVEKYYGNNNWGYSVTRLLPAVHHTAYKYSIALRNKYGLSYVEIDEILSMMPEDLRQRYTPDNTVELLKRTGHYRG